MLLYSDQRARLEREGILNSLSVYKDIICLPYPHHLQPVTQSMTKKKRMEYFCCTNRFFHIKKCFYA